MADSTLDRLRKAVIAQKTALLPAEAASPELQELHQALSAYDRHVSQMVIALLQGRLEAQAYPGAETLAKELDKAAQNSPNRRAVEQYRRYKERLDDMQELALTFVAEQGGPAPQKGR